MVVSLCYVLPPKNWSALLPNKGNALSGLILYEYPPNKHSNGNRQPEGSGLVKTFCTTVKFEKKMDKLISYIKVPISTTLFPYEFVTFRY